MKVRKGQLFLLTIWSILLILRQITDLIGRLWILVLADFLQLLLCIIGVFAVHQERKNLLVVHLIGCFLIIASNSLLIGWWMAYFGNIDRSILSFGLPYSFSFWIKYTPQCQSSFESSTGIERQSFCWVPFQWIESAISILFILLSLISSILSIINLCSKTKPRPPPIPALTLHKTTHHTASFPKRGLNFSSSHGGYANSVYEDDRMRPPSGLESVYGVRKDHRSLSTAETELSIGERRPYAEIRKERGLREGETMRGPSQRRFQRNKDRLDTWNVSRVERETKTTSLICFDPKSPTPIQVHELEESQSDDTASEPSIDDFVVRGPSRAQMMMREQRIWNEEPTQRYRREEEVPTTPVYGRYLGNNTNSSIDSAYGGSARREWNTVEGARSSPEWSNQHGLPLSNAPYPDSGRHSSFQIRPEGRSQMGGHYHFIEELQLMQPGGAHATISRDALLV